MEKPFDIGNTIISASITQAGDVVSLNCGHRKHGFIKLTSVKSFGNNDWYKPERVREYRNSFLSDETYSKAFGVRFKNLDNFNIIEPIHFDRTSNILRSTLKNNKYAVESNIFIPPNEKSLILLYKIKNLTDKRIDCNFTFGGELGIIRAAYGQITENGPIPIPDISNCIKKTTDYSYVLHEKGTESTSKIYLTGDIDKIKLLTPEYISSNPINVKGEGILSLDRKDVREFAVILTLTDSLKTDTHVIGPTKVNDLKNETIDFWENLHITVADKELEYIINRNFAYSFGCCCLSNFGAMITDHQSLPLTWNRDNYFMYKLMEEVYKKTKNPSLLIILKKHIKWMYSCVAIDGWGRSHLVTGKIKDRIFQFDQQCYPILELYDILKIVDLDKNLLSLCLSKLDKLSKLLLDKTGIDVMLFETDENPADDPVLYPYHFSTQILAWKTFEVLNELNEKYCFSSKNFKNISAKIRNDVLNNMISFEEGNKMFCYTTDAKGNFEFYHDANDLPTALAPLWGFIDVEDETFINTLKWAFSDKNRGFYPGKFGGLGSDHAQGHWPLGSAQLLFIATAQDKKKAGLGNKLFNEILQKIKSIVMKDGLFSESVYPDSGEVFTRYWFAWPGATISWIFLLSIK